MDDRQRYNYERDERNEDWRDRDRNMSGRDYQSNQQPFRNQGEYGERGQGYNRDWNRGQEQWNRNPDDYDFSRSDDFGRSGFQYGRNYNPETSRQVFRTSGSDRGYDREQNRGRDFNRDQQYQGADWQNRSRETYRNWLGRDEGQYGRNQSNYPDPYRSYGGQDYGRTSQNWGGNQNWGSNYDRSDWGSQDRSNQGRNFQSRDYGNRDYGSENYGQREGYGGSYGFGAEFGYGSGSYGRTRDLPSQQDYSRNQGYDRNRQDYGRDRDESFTEKVGRFFGMGPKGYKRSDDRIREDISERLEDHPEVDASNIEVSVRDGEVTLSGSVDNRRAKRLAEDIAEQSRGVKDVHNQIRVGTADISSTGATGTDVTTRKGATGTTGTDKTRAA